jgi:hypothetical protein
MRRYFLSLLVLLVLSTSTLAGPIAENIRVQRCQDLINRMRQRPDITDGMIDASAKIAKYVRAHPGITGSQLNAWVHKNIKDEDLPQRPLLQ